MQGVPSFRPSRVFPEFTHPGLVHVMSNIHQLEEGWEGQRSLVVSSGYIHVPAKILIPRCPSAERREVPLEPKCSLHTLWGQATSTTSHLTPKVMSSTHMKTSSSCRETRTNPRQMPYTQIFQVSEQPKREVPFTPFYR